MDKRCEKLVDKLISKLGFENEFTIKICRLAERGTSFHILERLVEKYNPSLK